jgi:hypothetical protein
MRETKGRVPGRRAAAAVLVAVALGAAAAPPAAATPLPNYLAQFVLMMDWVNRSIVYVPRHDADAELARVAHAVAETLVEQSQRLAPPDELRDLHPHFVLVLENAERAFHYLEQGDAERADRHFAVVRDETRMMRQIQRELGIEIPELAL